MESLCANLKNKCNDKENGATEEPCDHSFCTVQRRKKETNCVDIPPKGLPWSTGYLKYLPGQRGLYKDLYLKDLAEQEALKMQCPPCPPKKPKPKNCKKQNEADAACLCFCTPLNNANGGSSSRGSKKKRRKSYNRRSSDESSQKSQMMSDKQNCCIEFEQVFICDGTSSQPRKGFLVRPSKRPEAEMAMAQAEEAMGEDQEESSESPPADKGVICLCIPRQYLQQWRGPEEDLCAKYGVKSDCPEAVRPVPSASKGSIASRKSGASKKKEDKPEPSTQGE